MAKRKGRRGRKEPKFIDILPLFVVAVSMVFAFVFTVIIYPIVQSIPQFGARALFLVLLIISMTVASSIALVFYQILAKKIK